MLFPVLNSILNPIVRGILEHRRPFGSFDPASMFTPTTPGWVYDLSDFSTLFQDSAGTTPVTAVEQPVGLVLDKSQGLVLGPELVTNGTFDTNITGWTGTTAGGVVSWDAGRLKIVNQGAGYGYSTAPIQVVAGRTYLLSGVRSGASSSNISITKLATGTDSIYAGTTGAGPMEATFVADATATRYVSVRVQTSAVGGNAEFDNISVKLLPGNHASQPTSTKRPLLKVDGTGHYYLKGDGIDDFMSTAAIDFTGTDAISYWGGVQKLSDTNAGVVFELGTNSATVNGTFGLLAPHTGTSSTFAFNSRGTAYAQAVATGYASPYSGTISVANDISTPSLSIAVNADAAVVNTNTQGTGNYSKLPVYFMSRAGTSNFFGGQEYSSILLGRAATPTEAANSKAWVDERRTVTV